MIVIATHNGGGCLPRLIESIERHAASEHVVVVDNASTDKVFQAYLRTISHRVVRLDRSGYEVGALLVAAEAEPTWEDVLLLQDSTEITSADCLSHFRALRKASPCLLDVVVPIGFSPLAFGLRRTELWWLEDRYAITHGELHTLTGFQCNLLFTGRREIEHLMRLDLLSPRHVPEDKYGAMAMERGWAVACHRAGVQPHFISRYGEKNPYLNKFFLGRL